MSKSASTSTSTLSIRRAVTGSCHYYDHLGCQGYFWLSQSTVLACTCYCHQNESETELYEELKRQIKATDYTFV